MAIDCDPDALAAAAKCYCYGNQNQTDSVIIYLLAALAGDTSTPAQLAAKAKCYCFADIPTRDAVITYLLCQGANGGSSPPTPSDSIGSLGLFTYGDSPGTTDVVYLGASNTGAFDFETCSSITSLSAPNLTSITSSGSSGYIYITGCTAIASISLPLVTTVAGPYFRMDNNTALVSIDMHSLVSVAATINVNSNTALTTVNFAGFVPANGQNIGFANCALNAASVNQLLHRCALNAGFVSGIIDLSLGTNAAPTGQGIADKATLNARQPGLAVTN